MCGEYNLGSRERQTTKKERKPVDGDGDTLGKIQQVLPFAFWTGPAPINT